MILKRMKRRHLRDDTIAFCDAVRTARPDSIFGADIIAGFPTETDDMFADSLDIVRRCDLTHLHIFPFSPRPGTPAARMPQLERTIVKRRAAELRTLGAEQTQRHFAQEQGKIRQVLVETASQGRTEHFTPVQITDGAPGTLVDVQITGANQTALIGEAVQ
jgi:threonylcarbamoyladenosine tRNA methylthiotransferase MtaB